MKNPSCTYTQFKIGAACYSGGVSKDHNGECVPEISVSLKLRCCHCERTLIKMGKEFGNLAHISGITYFRLSPHEQKAFKGALSEGIPNLVRRFNGSVFRVAPFALLTYMVIKWGKEENHKLNRKNPKDFENDT